MPTPDDIAGGITDADLLLMEPQGLGGQSPTSPGEVTYSSVDGAFRMQDAIGVFDPRAGGGITASQHKALRDLIHFIDDGPADGFVSGAVHDTTYSGAFPVTEVWYEDSGRTQKIVQLDVTYAASLPVTEVWRMYDQDGVTVLVTLTDSITYTGIFESTRTRTWV